MTSVLQDVRYSLRMLLKHKGFTVVAVLTLALGIGVNTAMFSVLNTFLFGSLPYPDSNRLVRVFRTSPHSQNWPHSAANFFDQHDQNTVFEKMAAYNFSSRNLTEQGQTAERLLGLAATADFFPMLGVSPALGRVFNPEEFEPGADNVVVLTDRFWTRRFGNDPNIVGRTIQLDGKTVQIIGVMPAGFEHPILWGRVDLFQPLAFTKERKASRGNNYLSSFGRLKPGVTIEQAEQNMITLTSNINKQNSTGEGESVRLEPLQRSMSDSIGRKVMWFTFGLAGFVLLIACANLANLQLVRTATTKTVADGKHRHRADRRSDQSGNRARRGSVHQQSNVYGLAGRECATRLQSVRLRAAGVGRDGSALRDGSRVVGVARGSEPRAAREFTWIDRRKISASYAALADHRRSRVCNGVVDSGRIVSAWLTSLHQFRSRLAG
jgi:hypothetical protein